MELDAWRYHAKYIITQEFNKLTADNFALRLSNANLATKTDIAYFVKETDFNDKLKKLNKKITLNKIKHVLAANELNELWEKVKLLLTKNHIFFLR